VGGQSNATNSFSGAGIRSGSQFVSSSHSVVGQLIIGNAMINSSGFPFAIAIEIGSKGSEVLLLDFAGHSIQVCDAEAGRAVSASLISVSGGSPLFVTNRVSFVQISPSNSLSVELTIPSAPHLPTLSVCRLSVVISFTLGN
jgi:hypothetical protein